MGYILEDGKCKESTDDVSAIDPNCAKFKDNYCIKCSKNFYFGLNGLCAAVDPLCNGYDEATGACTGCYSSYILKGGLCI